MNRGEGAANGGDQAVKGSDHVAVTMWLKGQVGSVEVTNGRPRRPPAPPKAGRQRSLRRRRLFRPPQLKVRTPAHTTQRVWYVEFESRVTHRRRACVSIAARCTPQQLHPRTSRRQRCCPTAGCCSRRRRAAATALPAQPLRTAQCFRAAEASGTTGKGGASGCQVFPLTRI